jgi:phosphoglycerate kinase
MKRKNLLDLSTTEIEGKKALVRVDFNVPLSPEGRVTDYTRIRAAIPTIRLLIQSGAKVILCSHLGRPEGVVVEKLRLTPVGKVLSDLLGQNVRVCSDCIGNEVARDVATLKNGDVILLENVRFHKEEETNEPAFAKALASMADFYVNDAFGTAHRAHASTDGVARLLKPAVAGLLMEKELKYLEGAIKTPERPFAAIIGGSKVSSKIGVIEALLERADILLLGGGMVFTFYKARGYEIGSSLVEEEKVAYARELEEKAKAKGVELLLPVDIVVSDKFAQDGEVRTVACEEIPAGWRGLDIGPKTVEMFSKSLQACKTILWNGPMGVFEFAAFANGTRRMAVCLAQLTATGAITIVGGGDSVAAVEQAGLADKMSHISTGGGASLELLEGKELPGVACLEISGATC